MGIFDIIALPFKIVKDVAEDIEEAITGEEDEE